MATPGGAPRRPVADAPSAADVTVAFVDIVGFTHLCEELPVERTGDIVAWLERAATRAARGPVTLLKLVGDAAMLVGPQPAPVVAATLEIMRAGRTDPNAPPLHAGIASGRALSRGGDWLGRPVNYANHLAARAPAGSIEAVSAVADATADAWPWTPIAPAELGGLGEPIALYRLDA